MRVFVRALRLGLTVTAIVLVLTATAWAQPRAASTGGTRYSAVVSRLIAELDSDHRVERVRAEQRLLELGPEILPLLPAPELLSTAAVREAVGRVRFELERRHARASIAAAQVSLDGTRSLAEWVGEISRQSGNRVDCSALPVDLQKQSIPIKAAGAFWPVVDRLCEPLGVRYHFDASAQQLQLVTADAAGGSPELAVVNVGAVRIAVLSAQTRRNFANPTGRLLRVHLQIVAEPRLRTLFLQYAAADILASSSVGPPLKLLNPLAQYEHTLSGEQSTVGVQLDYLIPAGVEIGMIKLRGKIHLTTAAASERIAFKDVQELARARSIDVARRRGGVTVRLNRVLFSEPAPGKREARVRVTLAYDSGGPAFESHRTWILHNQVFLEDVDQRAIELNGGFEMTLQADGAVGLEYRFRELPEFGRIATFVYMAPTLIMDVPVEFTIQSCPVEAAPRIP